MKNLFSIRERELTWRIIIVSIIVFAFSFCGFCIYYSYETVKESKKMVYVLVNKNKLIEAQAEDVTNTNDIRTRNAILHFNELIFKQVPDPEQINKQLREAVVLSDKSTTNVIDSYVQGGFYKSIVAQNYFTLLLTDSIKVDYGKVPNLFVYYGKLKIIRKNDMQLRQIVTTGEVQYMGASSENNKQGFIFSNFNLAKDDKIDLR